MSLDVINYTTTSALATSGTVTLSYPTGRGKGSYSNVGNYNHVMIAGQNKYVSPKDFTLTFNANASGITLTYLGSTTIPSGTLLQVQVERRGSDYVIPGSVVPADKVNVYDARLAVVDLGSPAAASATAVLATTAVANGNLVTLATPVTLDSCGRPLVYVSSNVGDTTQTVTVRGTDYFGNAMTETVTMNGTTTVAGKKAFYKVISYQASAALTGTLSIGTGTLLGLPVYAPAAGYLLKELQDGSAATAGTFTVADTAKATATTGDVRGTYTPNAAPDGSKGYVLIIAVTDWDSYGNPQYAG